MNSQLFPDVNVWVALNHDQHQHHAAAKRWYEAIPDSARLVFCRQTQLGLFRILTTVAVMGNEIVTQHRLLADLRPVGLNRPGGMGERTWEPRGQVAKIDRRIRFITKSVDGRLSDGICRKRGVDTGDVRPRAGGKSEGVSAASVAVAAAEKQPQVPIRLGSRTRSSLRTTSDFSAQDDSALVRAGFAIAQGPTRFTRFL